jgi:WD40 repeat protein
MYLKRHILDAFHFYSSKTSREFLEVICPSLKLPRWHNISLCRENPLNCKEAPMNKPISVACSIFGLSAVALLTWATAAVSADPPGIWKATGSMATSRIHSQRETLPDGRIIVIGGSNTTGVDGSASIFHATTELYDPVTGTWTTTGSLTTGGRALHTSSRLPDGRILVTGGWNGSTALSSAEIYDPATGTWTATGSMTTGRAGHRDQILFDGRILITGGFDSAGNPLASAEIYNPATGTFTATGSMGAARRGHRTNNAGSGKVLVTGGFGAGDTALASAELFDPATGTFSAAPSMAQARGHHFATELPTGEVLVSGGFGGGGVLNSSELYDPDTNTFVAGGTLNQARQSHSSQLLPNGLVLISGGNTTASANRDVQTNFLSSAELYDRATNTFTPTGSKINATSGSGATIVLWTGQLLYAGGGTNAAELYTPEMPGTPEAWIATANLAAARTSHQQNLLGDGRVLLSGGLDAAGNPLASAVLYDYVTGTFSATGNMNSTRQQHRNADLYTGKVLVTGGRPNPSSGVLNSAELYDPATGNFTATGNMVRFRRIHRATELRNGKVLLTGGLGGTTNTSNTIQSIAELYDPATGTFTQTTGGLNTARRSHQATLLYTGKVLVAGGFDTSTTVTASAELYDPVANSFTATGSMITARTSPNLTRLPDGKILVSGGSDATGTPIQSVEIYDPATGVFTAAGNALVARDGNRVTRLDNGRIIFVGGQTTVDATSVTSSADLYNHVTGTFAATGSLSTARQDFSQTSLPNGRILVAGGIDAAGNALTSAELYTPAIGEPIVVSTSLLSAILPSSRSVQVGTPATAFATIINAGSNTATSCGVSPITNIPASFTFQTTDPATNAVIGSPNSPVDIAAGAFQSYVFALTPTAPFAPTDVQLSFVCANTDPAPINSGLNTLLFSASASPIPDIVALAATLNNDGIVNVPGTNGTGAFAVATVNVGASGDITASADTGTASLPVNISLCQTDPGTGQCISAIGGSVTTTINANATPTFGIFVQGAGTVPFDPAANRIFVRFKDGSDVTRGSTSVAVRTQ